MLKLKPGPLAKTNGKLDIDWRPWAPRPVQMPGCTTLPDGRLLIQGGPRGDIFGGFRGRIAPLKAGRRYKVTVLATLSGIGSPRQQTWVQINAGGDHFRVLADVHLQPDGRCRYEMVIQAAAKEAILDVLLVRCLAGRIVVERTDVEEIPAAKPRWCRVCAFHDYPTQIIDPAGTLIAEAKLPRGTKKFLYHKIDLANPPVQSWYGVMRDLQYKERRDEVYVRTAGQPGMALPRYGNDC